MAQDMAELVGAVAGSLTTLAFVPQVVRTWRTRSTDDISLVMYASFSVGVALWGVYGVLIGSPAVVVTNAVTLCLALIVLAIKLGNRDASDG